MNFLGPPIKLNTKFDYFLIRGLLSLKIMMMNIFCVFVRKFLLFWFTFYFIAKIWLCGHFYKTFKYVICIEWNWFIRTSINHKHKEKNLYKKENHHLISTYFIIIIILLYFFSLVTFSAGKHNVQHDKAQRTVRHVWYGRKKRVEEKVKSVRFKNPIHN